MAFDSRRYLLCMALAIAAGGIAAADPPPRRLAPDVIEGSLRAAGCVLAVSADGNCTARALARADVGGVATDAGYTLLLVDGRTLLRSCAARSSTSRLRASGLLHDRGRSMSVFYLEEDCGGGWRPVALPYSGISGGGAEGGDE